MTDRWAGMALLVLLAALFIAVFESFNLRSGLLVLGLLVAPFTIFLLAIRRGAFRTSRGWDRPDGENGKKTGHSK